MGQMVKEQNKKIKSSKDKIKDAEYIDFHKMIFIAIVFVIFLTIVFIMVIIFSTNKRIKNDKLYEDINIEISQNEKIINFVNDYFSSRASLRFDKIFDAYNRDYVEEVKNSNGSDIVTSIKYENSFIKSFEDIKIYEAKGRNDGEYVLVLSFDIVLNFSDGKIPSLLTCYLYTENDNLYIKDHLDVGDIKYINLVLENDFIKNLYESTKLRLENTLSSSESAKLVYNSLRQFDMNDMKAVNNNEIEINEYIDPILDKDYIYDRLKKTKKEEEKEEIMESIFGGSN